MIINTTYILFKIVWDTVWNTYELTCNLDAYPHDYLCVNLPDYFRHDTPSDRLRVSRKRWLMDLHPWPRHKYVTSVYSPLNADPLKQLVIRFHLPDSWIPESILDSFRADARMEARARLYNQRWRKRMILEVMHEPLFRERQPFYNTRARFVVREFNGRFALFDRRYSWTQPVYSPIVYYRH